MQELVFFKVAFSCAAFGHAYFVAQLVHLALVGSWSWSPWPKL